MTDKVEKYFITELTAKVNSKMLNARIPKKGTSSLKIEAQSLSFEILFKNCDLFRKGDLMSNVGKLSEFFFTQP